MYSYGAGQYPASQGQQPPGYEYADASQIVPQMGYQVPLQNPQITGQYAGQLPVQSQASQTAGFQQQLAAPLGNPNATIPSKQLSFITPQDQKSFADLFRASLTPGEQALSGDQARNILLRSGLSQATLGDIWQLADTTRAGKLMFPEFCLAMYLCSRTMRGDPVPQQLSSSIRKEVTDMVDQISFAIPETPAQPAQQRLAPAPRSAASAVPPVGPFQQQPLLAQQTSTLAAMGQYGAQLAQPSQQDLQPQITGGYPLRQQPTGGYPLQVQRTGPFAIQTQATGSALQLEAQRTGPYPLLQQMTGAFQQLQPQVTGGFQPQPQIGVPFSTLQPQITGSLQPQRTGGALQPQYTGGFVQPLQPQRTGGYLQPMQPQRTGEYGQPQLQAQMTGGRMPLQSQLTGGPNPLQPQITGGYQQLQTQPTGRPGHWGFINAATPGIDNFRVQFLRQAPQISSSQALAGNATVEAAISKKEKEIYDTIFSDWDRRRTGYIDGPTAIEIFGKSALPRSDLEAIWNLCDTGNKGKLNRDAFAVAMHLIYRKLNGYDIPLRLPPELVPPSNKMLDDTVAQVKQFLKKSENKSGGGPVSYQKAHSFAGGTQIRKDATTFKNDDDEVAGYKSAARHRPLTAKPNGSPQRSDKSNNLADLKKKIHEKKIILEALDVEDEENAVNRHIDKDNERAIEELKAKIVAVQNKLDARGSSTSSSGISRSELLHRSQLLRDTLPQLTSRIKKVESEIAITKIQLEERKFQSEHPNMSITATGPGGTITERDRNAARRRAELRARMNAITGKEDTRSSTSDFEEFDRVMAQAKQTIEKEQQTNLQSLRALEESCASVQRDLERHLNEPGAEKSDRERRRWEEAVGVEPAVREFIMTLRNVHAKSESPSRLSASATSMVPSLQGKERAAAETSKPKAGTETPAERIARIRAEADRRTRERLAKAGINLRSKSEDKSEEKLALKPLSETSSASPKNQSVKPGHVAENASSTLRSIESVNSGKVNVQSDVRKAETPKHDASTLAPDDQHWNTFGSSQADDIDNDEEMKAMERELREHEERVKRMEQERAERIRAADMKKQKAQMMASLKAKKEQLELRERELRNTPPPDAESSDDDTLKSLKSPSSSNKPKSAVLQGKEDETRRPPLVQSTVRRPTSRIQTKQASQNVTAPNPSVNQTPPPVTQMYQAESSGPKRAPANHYQDSITTQSLSSDTPGSMQPASTTLASRTEHHVPVAAPPAPITTSAPPPQLASSVLAANSQTDRSPSTQQPFAMTTKTASQTSVINQSKPDPNYNPFHRGSATKSRPIDDDDEWGDSNGEIEDDEPRGAATPAQLASLLFGSMGSQRPLREPEKVESATIKSASPSQAQIPAPPVPSASGHAEANAAVLQTSNVPPPPPMQAPSVPTPIMSQNSIPVPEPLQPAQPASTESTMQVKLQSDFNEHHGGRSAEQTEGYMNTEAQAQAIPQIGFTEHDGTQGQQKYNATVQPDQNTQSYYSQQNYVQAQPVETSNFNAADQDIQENNYMTYAQTDYQPKSAGTDSAGQNAEQPQRAPSHSYQSENTTSFDEQIAPGILPPPPPSMAAPPLPQSAPFLASEIPAIPPFPVLPTFDALPTTAPPPPPPGPTPTADAASQPAAVAAMPGLAGLLGEIQAGTSLRKAPSQERQSKMDLGRVI